MSRDFYPAQTVAVDKHFNHEMKKTTWSLEYNGKVEEIYNPKSDFSVCYENLSFLVGKKELVAIDERLYPYIEDVLTTYVDMVENHLDDRRIFPTLPFLSQDNATKLTDVVKCWFFNENDHYYDYSNRDEFISGLKELEPTLLEDIKGNIKTKINEVLNKDEPFSEKDICFALSDMCEYYGYDYISFNYLDNFQYSITLENDYSSQQPFELLCDKFPEEYIDAHTKKEDGLRQITLFEMDDFGLQKG